MKNKYLKLIQETYKEGIIEDLKNGRHISAIICGYGATFVDDYNLFAETLKNFDWFNKEYDKDKNGEI